MGECSKCGNGRKYFQTFRPKSRKCRVGRGFCRGKICFVNLNKGCADGIYISEFRCPFRVGRKVLLVVRFGQRIKVGLTTLLSALGEGVYDLITLRARVILWLFFFYRVLRNSQFQHSAPAVGASSPAALEKRNLWRKADHFSRFSKCFRCVARTLSIAESQSSEPRANSASGPAASSAASKAIDIPFPVSGAGIASASPTRQPSPNCG